jgi:hypothetical protein
VVAAIAISYPGSVIEPAALVALIDAVLDARCSCVEPGVFGHPCRGELLGRELKPSLGVDSPEQLAAYRPFEIPLLSEPRDLDWRMLRYFASAPIVSPDNAFVLLATV